MAGDPTPARGPALGAWSALVAVYQGVLHEVVRALEQEAGVDSGVFSALAYLERAGRRLGVSELRALMHPRYSQPGMSRLLQRMEGDGLIERRPDPDDGRATMLMLTRSGRARFRRANAVYESALEEHFARHVTSSESRALAELLDRLLTRRHAARDATGDALARSPR